MVVAPHVTEKRSREHSAPERSSSSAPADVDDTVFIFDLRNFGMTHSDTKTPIGMIKSLQVHFDVLVSASLTFHAPPQPPPALFRPAAPAATHAIFPFYPSLLPQTGYPERMAMCIIYQPPRLFNLVWKVLRYIINARVHAKARERGWSVRRLSETAALWAAMTCGGMHTLHNSTARAF